MLLSFCVLRRVPPPFVIAQYTSFFRFSAAIAAKCVPPALKCKKGRLPPPRFQYFSVQPPPHCRGRRPRRPSFCRAGPMCPAAGYALISAGHAGPALQDAAIAGGCGHPPLRTSNGAFRAGRRTKVNGLPRPPHPTPPQNTTNAELFCRKSSGFVTLSLIIRLLSCNFSLPVVDWFRIAV